MTEQILSQPGTLDNAHQAPMIVVNYPLYRVTVPGNLQLPVALDLRFYYDAAKDEFQYAVAPVSFPASIDPAVWREQVATWYREHHDEIARACPA